MRLGVSCIPLATCFNASVVSLVLVGSSPLLQDHSWSQLVLFYASLLHQNPSPSTIAESLSFN